MRVNGTFLAWTGYRREDLVGRKRFVDLLTPGGRIYHETHYAPLLRMQATVQEIAFTMVRADGGRLPVLVNSRLERGADGTPGLTLTSVFNATDRRRYEQELMLARRNAEGATARLALMQTVAAQLAAAGDLAQVNDVLVRSGQNALGADACVLWLRSEGQRALLPLAAAGVGAPLSSLARLSATAPAATDEELVAGQVVMLPADRARGRFPTVTAVLGARSGTVAIAPILERGRVLGVLGCRFDRIHAEDTSLLDLLGTLVGQAGLAIPRARLFEEQRDVAQTLQRSLLPADLPHDPRFTLATSYRPAQGGPAVGGDWYDAFWLPDDRIALVVGDVVGRGVHAAAAMGQLRSGIRALASISPDPAHLLDALDAFVESVPGAGSATVVYAVLDVGTGQMLYACAGHPPPVLLGADGRSTLLWEGRSVPLGIRVAEGHRTEAEAVLAPGSRLLLYTDGLVERRDVSLDVRIDELAARAAAHAGLPPAELVEQVADVMLDDSQAPDDVCLLCLSLPRARGVQADGDGPTA